MESITSAIPSQATSSVKKKFNDTQEGFFSFSYLVRPLKSLVKAINDSLNSKEPSFQSSSKWYSSAQTNIIAIGILAGSYATFRYLRALTTPSDPLASMKPVEPKWQITGVLTMGFLTCAIAAIAYRLKKGIEWEKSIEYHTPQRQAPVNNSRTSEMPKFPKCDFFQETIFEKEDELNSEENEKPPLEPLKKVIQPTEIKNNTNIPKLKDPNQKKIPSALIQQAEYTQDKENSEIKYIENSKK